MTHDPMTFAKLFGIDPDYKNAPSDYEQGQQDMLAKCIAAVAACESTSWHRRYEGPWKYRIERDDALAALRALQEKP